MPFGRSSLFLTIAALIFSADALLAQNPPPPPPTTGSGVSGGGGRGGGRGGAQQGRGRGRGGGAIQQMTLSTLGWQDGGVVPIKYSQAGAEVSPFLTWSNPPGGTASFVLHVYNANVVSGAALDPELLWLVWNIPGTLTALPEGFPQGPQQPDGTRQISTSGPYYRGPAAPATGAVNHYIFELYALDTLIALEPVGASPAATRAALLQAMAGRVRGKALLFGLFRRPE